MAFSGYLIKVGPSGSEVEIPLKYMRAETYSVTPDQRLEWSAERDVTGVLHRETVANMPPKIEFNTPLMTNSDINTLNTILSTAYSVAAERKLRVTYYDPETDGYKSHDCYMPDVKYEMRMVDTASNVIHYNELRYAFIGY